MDDGWLLLAALAAVVGPLALAGWLIGRLERPPVDSAARRGKIPPV